MRFVLSGTDTITLSGQAADKLIRAGDGGAVLLYLYVLRTGGALSVREAARTLGRDESSIAESMALLNRLGLLKCDAPAPAPQKDELPEYTAEDIKRELDNGTVFSSLVQEVQRSLGKILSSDDLIKLFGIYDSLGLPPEVILHLVTHCIDENRRRYGPGRLPTMRYIEKAAYTWEREGVFTLEEAERYLKVLESKRSLTADIKRVLQIKDRELSAGERKYVESWIAMGFPPEVIELAYDKTVLKTGRLAWSYMDSIIGSWHQKGLRTLDEILKKDGRAAPAPKKDPKKPARPAGDDLADIERMKKYLEKLREE
ncbi:DnaD domain protein [Sporobacter termitidis]|nr:DnaD domain protein [Sporobacter termitidis]